MLNSLQYSAPYSGAWRPYRVFQEVWTKIQCFSIACSAVPWEGIFLKFIYFFICSEFCHTLKWNSHGFTCVPHADPPTHLPLHPLPLGLPSAPGPSACLMNPTWAGDLFHPRFQSHSDEGGVPLAFTGWARGAKHPIRNGVVLTHISHSVPRASCFLHRNMGWGKPQVSLAIEPNYSESSKGVFLSVHSWCAVWAPPFWGCTGPVRPRVGPGEHDSGMWPHPRHSWFIQGWTPSQTDSGKADHMYRQRPHVAGITAHESGLAVVVFHPHGPSAAKKLIFSPWNPSLKLVLVFVWK